jgi:RNA polymerase sigma factor (sigma-70 family)
MDSAPHQRFLEQLAPHEPALWRLAGLHARGRGDREDLYQELVLQLWRSFGNFRGESSYSTFVYRVALNTALAWNRKARSLTPTLSLEDLPDTEDSRTDDSTQVRELLATAIQKLAPLDRSVIGLALEGLSYEEIASITGLSVSNVGTRLSRNKSHLRSILEDKQ